MNFFIFILLCFFAVVCLFTHENLNNLRTRYKRSTNETLDIGYRISEDYFFSFENSSINKVENDHERLVERFKELWPVEMWKQQGFFTDDYLEFINDHWLKYPPPSEAVQKALGCFYIIFVTFGLGGNALVLFMYIRCRQLRTPGNILVANLALSDFMMLAKTPIFIFNSFHQGPALGNPGCVVYGFIGGLSGTTSIATLTGIALDRYWAVVRPLDPLRALTAIRARFLVLFAWLYAALFSTIPALDIGYGRYVPEGFLTSCSFDYLTDELKPRYFIFIFFCAAWIIPFCTIAFCYLKILTVVIFNRNINIRNQEKRLSSRHIKEQVKRKAEMKLAVLVIAVIALFFLSWTPYAIVSLIGIFGNKQLITPVVSMAPALFCKTAACVNPFIYIISHPNFRQGLRKIFTRKLTKRMRYIPERSYYNSDTNNIDTSCKEVSDVEIIQMKDIPYGVPKSSIETVDGSITRRSNYHATRVEFDESFVPPPSWFNKPEFSKSHSSRRFSYKRNRNISTDILQHY